MLQIVATPGGSRFKVRVIPKSRTIGFDGLRGDALLCRVGAAPVDGAANETLIRLLAQALGVPKTAITVARGHRSRSKEVHVDGVTPAHVLEAVSASLESVGR